MSIIFRGTYVDLGSFSATGAHPPVAGTVGITPAGGSTTTETLSGVGSYTATLAGFSGKVTVVETITGLAAPITTVYDVLDGTTTTTSKDIFIPEAPGNIPIGTYATTQTPGVAIVAASKPQLDAAAGDRRSISATQGVNIIAGYSGNAIATGSDACTILGGGWNGQENTIDSVMQLATIVGGYNNKISGSVPANPSTIAGGSHNRFSGTATHGFIAGSDNQITALGNATITGGTGNRCSSQGGVISGGFNNTISGASSSYAVIGGGIGNSATALDATVCGGFTNVASNTGATVVGGGENTAAGTYSVAAGYRANAQYSRKFAHAGGMFTAAGDAQESFSVLSQLTTDATVSYMRLDGTAGNTLPLTVPVDGAMMLSIIVVARRLTSESGYPSEAKGWDLRNLVTRNSTTIATGTLGSTTYGTPTWTADLFVSSNGSVFVQVTGEAAKTIRWVASVRAAEVIA